MSELKGWKPCELFILKQFYNDNTFTVEEIGKILGRCGSDISRKAYKLGMSRCPDMNTKNKYLGVYYDDISLLYRQGLTNFEVARKLGFDVKIINRVARKCGLRSNVKVVDKEIIKKEVIRKIIIKQLKEKKILIKDFNSCDFCICSWKNPCNNCLNIEKSIELEISCIVDGSSPKPF